MRKWLRALIPIGIGAITTIVLIGATRQLTAQATASWAAQSQPAHAVTLGGNLLINPDFEDGYSYPLPCCNNIAVPIGWNIRWYTDTPSSGYIDYTFKQPEVKIIDATVWPFCCQLLLPPRIHSGRYAVESFVLFANQDTSFYQQVGGVPIGVVVTASAWVHAWVSSCDPTPSITPVLSLQGPTQSGCPNNYWPIESSRMRVGIDPYGGTDPRGSTVVWNRSWTDPQGWGPYDYYSSTLPVVTTAQAHTVTIFLRAVTTTPAKHDNIYFDDASLTYTFPMSASVVQDKPWPLPASVTITVRAPVSFTQVAAAAAGPTGSGLALQFLGTSGVTPTFESRWRTIPASGGRHVFTLTTFELAQPFAYAFDVAALSVDVRQDQVPPSGHPITLSLTSPVSLTGLGVVMTDPLGSALPITAAGTSVLGPDILFQWVFIPNQPGAHTLQVNAGQFTQPLVQQVFVASARVYLPIVLR